MSENVVTVGSHQVAKRPRAWWQWTLGFVLLGVALASGVIRVVAWISPDAFAPAITYRPIPLKVPPELKDADVVPAKAGEFEGSNLLVVTLDTTRADHLGCYGNSNVDTSTMDALAKEGILFSNAISSASTTLPSHSTIMTGLYPYHHGARANGVFRLPEETETIAEVLSKNGYATAGVISAYVLDSRYGLAQGFTTYVDELEQEPVVLERHEQERFANHTTDIAMDWLKDHAGKDKPFFMWLHYFDVHQPYEPPSPYKDRYSQALYDGELAYVDDQLARVIDFLEERDLRDRTLVVVIGDHGQGLGQHEELTHGLLLYDTTLHVPFIMNCGSRLGGGLHISKPVSSCDVMPTVLAMLGVEGPEACDGVDLTKQYASDERTIFSDTLEGFVQHAFAPLMVVRQGPMKYIYGPEPELYNLAEDPHELNDLISQKPEVASALDEKLRAFYENDLEQAGKAQPSEQLSSEDMEKLRALGYVSLGADSVEAYTGPLPNPKSMARQVRIAEMAFGKRYNDLDASITELSKLADENPDFYTAHRWLAQVLMMANRYADAKVALERCEAMHPNVPTTLSMLAKAEARLGNDEAAIERYRHTIALHPDHFGAQIDLGRMLLAQGDRKGALQHLRKACFLRPTDMEAMELMAYVSRSMGKAGEDIVWMQQRLEKEPNNAAVLSALCGLMMEVNRCQEVLPLLKQGVERHPELPQLRNNLAIALLSCGAEEGLPPVEAVVTIEQVCRETDYKVPEYLRTLAAAYAQVLRMDEAVAIAERAKQLALSENNRQLAQVIEMSLQQYRKAQEEGVAPMRGDEHPPESASNTATTQPVS